jgi:hypothetical protein
LACICSGRLQAGAVDLAFDSVAAGSASSNRAAVGFAALSRPATVRPASDAEAYLLSPEHTNYRASPNVEIQTRRREYFEDLLATNH